jgi:hydroxylamine reductase (hybrid-cluster protein)
MGISERQKGPSEPSDYLGLRVSHSLSPQKFSEYKRKAVAVLLTLLHLEVRNMRIGPTLPAFLSPGVLARLHKKFNLMAIINADADLAAMLS